MYMYTLALNKQGFFHCTYCFKRRQWGKTFSYKSLRSLFFHCFSCFSKDVYKMFKLFLSQN